MLACPGGGCLVPARIKDYQHLSAGMKKMHIYVCNVVPRLKIHLFQLFLKAERGFTAGFSGIGIDVCLWIFFTMLLCDISKDLPMI